MVGSWEVQHLDEPAMWFEQARASFECSIHLCQGIVRDELPRTFLHGQVVMQSAFHGTEMFYKGIIAASGFPVPGTHNLQSLRSQAEALAPQAAEFFPHLFHPEHSFGSPDDENVRVRIAQDARLQEQQLRYHVNLEGRRWWGSSAFVAETFLQDLRFCMAKLDLIVPRQTRGEQKAE